jgi:hypothetical protein
VQTGEFGFDLKASSTVLGVPVTERTRLESSLTANVFYGGLAQYTGKKSHERREAISALFFGLALSDLTPTIS